MMSGVIRGLRLKGLSLRIRGYIRGLGFAKMNQRIHDMKHGTLNLNELSNEQDVGLNQ